MAVAAPTKRFLLYFRLRRRALRLLLPVMLPAFFASAPVAQEVARENEDRTFQNWIFRCEMPAQRCYVFQNVHLEATGQRVIGVVAGALGPNGERILHFTVPLGLYLPIGVALRIDDAAQFTAPVETCVATGCELAIALDDPRLKTLPEALVVRVGFLDAVTRRQITVAISMQGFKDAYAAMTDAAMTDAAMPDAAMPTAAMPDAAMPDAAMPDAAMPDAAMPDAAMPDE